jgi:hypothetical protein
VIAGSVALTHLAHGEASFQINATLHESLQLNQKHAREMLEKYRAPEFEHSCSKKADRAGASSSKRLLGAYLTATPKLGWCPGPESNRYVPFGTRDFKPPELKPL